jgi:DNA-directed RNA polymerase subunit alpha
MATATAREQLEDLLAGPLDRDNYGVVVNAVYESFTTVDLAQDIVRRIVEELEIGTAEDRREASEKAGILLFALGEFDEAAQWLREVSSRKGAAFFLGWAYLRLGKPEDAVSCIERGRLDDDDVAADTLLMEAYSALRQVDEAEATLKRVEGSDSADALYIRALAADIVGDYADVLDLARAALEADPEHAGALFLLARNCDTNGEDDEAIDYYKRCADLKPTYVGALINLGLLYEDHDKYDEAIVCYRRVLAISPRHSQARLFLKDAVASQNMYVDPAQIQRIRRMDDILGMPLSSFELTPRSRACLDRMNLKTVGGLTRVNREELLSEKNFGDTSLDEVEALLSRYGLTLEGMGQHEVELPTEENPAGEQAGVTIESLGLSTRCRKCLDRLGITMVGELVLRTEKELLQAPNFGTTSLNEIRETLAGLGLELHKDTKNDV